MERDLTQGAITKTMLRFALPMVFGNLLQQCYNFADTLIVGKFLGADALAAVGSAYTLMTFLTSIIIGLCMGGGSVLSVRFGSGGKRNMKDAIVASFIFIASVTVILNVLAFAGIDVILHMLQTPSALYDLMREYVSIIFCGIFFTFLYNYFSFLLRAIGDSIVPLIFLGTAAVLNIALDFLLVVAFGLNVGGVAAATVIAQAVAGIGIVLYVFLKEPHIRPGKNNFKIQKKTVAHVVRQSCAACVQQSVMNFGILMIQGLVNSFGPIVMAAFAAAVKIDALAYMPAQEFGNAFSLFISQNYGAKKFDRIRTGARNALLVSAAFCLSVSFIVFVFAPYFMQIFVNDQEYELIQIGTEYLRIEGSFYVGIGVLFLLYGFYRGIEKPGMALILTVISLGTRVALSYIFAPIQFIGVYAIWWAIPIGWILADLIGIFFLKKKRKLVYNRDQ